MQMQDPRWVVMLLASLLAGPAAATTISTQFDTSDGFVTGDFNPVTLTNGAFSATFAGGQQQQMFDLASYNVNPAGYLFINGTFVGSTGNSASGDGGAVDGIPDDGGFIDFNQGVGEVSFFAANRGFGAGVTLNVFGVDDTTLLDSILITQTSNQAADGAVATVITAAGVGGPIGRIEVDLPGPAGNPPYVLALDTFSATVPAPGTLLLLVSGLAGFAAIRRR